MVIKTVAALSTCLTKGFSAIYVCWWSCLSAPCPISPRPLHPIFKFCYMYAVVKKSIIPYKCRNHGSVSQLSLHYQMTKNCLQSKTVRVVWPVPILNCTISKKKIMHTQANNLMTVTFSQHPSLLQELLSEAHLCFV